MNNRKDISFSRTLKRRQLLAYGAPVAAAGALLGTFGATAPAAHASGETLASAMWVHGNATTVENPSSTAYITHSGWAIDIGMNPGASSWCHIPLPTPVIGNGVRYQLLQVFILFQSDPGYGRITNVHVYDGGYKIQEFNGLSLEGLHGGGLDGDNTFVLNQPHSVAFGIGLSFRYEAAACTDGACGPSNLYIATAGADYILP